jgi:hypothetical protein
MILNPQVWFSPGAEAKRAVLYRIVVVGSDADG